MKKSRWDGIEYNERQASLWHNKLAHIILYGADERGREHLVEARTKLAALLEQRVPGNQRHRTARWWESKKTSLQRMWNDAEEVASGTRAPKLARDRGSKRPSVARRVRALPGRKSDVRRRSSRRDAAAYTEAKRLERGIKRQTGRNRR